MNHPDSSKKFEITNDSPSKKFDIAGSKKRFEISKPPTKFAIQEDQEPFIQTTSIERIIRKVDSPDSIKVNPATEQIILINPQTGEIVSQRTQAGIRRLFRLGRRETQYYWVSTQNTVECRLVCPVNDIATNRSIHIRITYEVRCRRGNEAIVTSALYKDHTPGDGLKRFIINWIRSFKRELSVDFIQNYFHVCDQLSDQICYKAQEELGLTLQVNLELEHEKQLAPYPLHSSSFPVRVGDCNDEIRLKFETELDVDEDRKISAILHYPELPELETLMRDKIKRTLLENFTLHDLCYELNHRVQRTIIEDLREPLFNVGRVITYLNLESSATSLIPQETSTIEHIVRCKIKECPIPVHVEHRVLMSLEDIGKYRSARITQLEDWVKNKLERITQSALFDKTYVDILLEFAPHEIKRQMELEAAAIGYTIRHLTAIPNLEPLKLKDGFKIEQEGTFVTHDSRVKVKLHIIVRGVIRDLRNIERYLNPQIDILEKMKETVREETEQLIHHIEPERFYMHFYYSDDPNEISVEQELKNGIARKLQESFAASEIDVTPKQLETKIARRFQELQKGFDSFELEIFPLSDEGYGEPVKFHVDFKILGVDRNGWYTFQSNDFQSREEEIQHIQKILEEDVKTKLETVPISFIQYTDIKNWKEIKGAVDLSIQKIVSVFGLVIEVINLRRLPTVSELGTQKDLEARRQIAEHTRDTEIQMAQMTNKDQLTQLDQLFQKRRELTEAGIPEDDPEYEEISQRIQKIIQEPPSYSIQTDKQRVKQLKSQSTQQLSLKDQFEEQNPPESSDEQSTEESEGERE